MSAQRWLASKDFSNKDDWSLTDCLDYLKLSEVTQKLLPGAPEGRICSVKAGIGKRAQALICQNPIQMEHSHQLDAAIVSTLNDLVELIRILAPTTLPQTLPVIMHHTKPLIHDVNLINMFALHALQTAQPSARPH